MIVAISQPEHFPYEGFFSKMAAADVFVLLDDVQFSGPRSFQNRNRFINGKGDQQWFGVPVRRGSYYELLKDVQSAEVFGWREKVCKTLFQRYKVDLSNVYANDSLFDINVAGIRFLMSTLKISTSIVRSSDLGCIGTRSERLANICRELGATTYLSGPGGAAYLDHAYFVNIPIAFHDSKPRTMMTSLELLKL